MVDPTHADDVPYIGWYLPYVYLNSSSKRIPTMDPERGLSNPAAMVLWQNVSHRMLHTGCMGGRKKIKMRISSMSGQIALRPLGSATRSSFVS